MASFFSVELYEKAKKLIVNTSKLKLALVASVAILIGWILWPRMETERILEPVAQAEPVQSSAAINIHVVGEVISPGLYELELGSRVSDVIEMAGGFSELASSQSVNLARILIDGEQLVVSSEQTFTEEQDSKISINEASVEKLDELPGVGPSIASKIVDHRQKIGRFRSIEQLVEVSGIGPKMIENIRELIRL